MKKRSNRLIKMSIIIAILIAIATICKFMSWNTKNVIVEQILNFIRVFIYICIFSLWGLSIKKRVIQAPVRRALIIVAILMVLWLIVREIKFRFIKNEDIIRYLWYIYYIPLLSIPLCALFTSMMVGKQEDYKLPKLTFLLTIPTVILIILMLSNDLHQLAFSFPEGEEIWTEKNYHYGFLYYIDLIWIAMCSILALAIMIVKTRIPQNRKYLWITLFPFIIAIVYSVLYAMRVSFVFYVIGDISVFFCIIFTSFFEICIQCGLIQSNTRYFELFNAIVDNSVQIVDENLVVQYSSKDAEKIDNKKIEKAKEQPIIIGQGKRLHNMRIDGGYAIWTENVLELFELNEKLKVQREELKEKNDLLQYEYQKEKEHKTIMEKNRLYELLEGKTQNQINKINELMQKYSKSNDEQEKYNILANIIILGSYIKRKKNFILSMENPKEINELMLTSALEESYNSIKLLGIKGSFFVEIDKQDLSGKLLEYTYDFFENVLEMALDKIHFINFRICKINEVIRANILIDSEYVLENLKEKYPNIKIIKDEGTQILLPIEIGGDQNE